MTTTDQPAALTCTYDTSSRSSYSATPLPPPGGQRPQDHPRLRRDQARRPTNPAASATPPSRHASTYNTVRRPDARGRGVHPRRAGGRRRDQGGARGRQARGERPPCSPPRRSRSRRSRSVRYHAISDPSTRSTGTPPSPNDLPDRGAERSRVAIAIPRWRVVRVDEDDHRDLFDSEVKISEHLGETRLEVRACVAHDPQPGARPGGGPLRRAQRDRLSANRRLAARGPRARVRGPSASRRWCRSRHDRARGLASRRGLRE